MTAERVFSGSNVQEAMEAVKAAFGEDASIIDIVYRAKGVVDIVAESSNALSPSRLADQIEKVVVANHPVDKPLYSNSNISSMLSAKLGMIINDRKGSVSERVEVLLAEQLKIDEEINFLSRFVAVMGSSGAGKTSTVFKLAHQFQEGCGLSCGVLHLDSGKVPQFANQNGDFPIVSLPLAECYPAALAQFMSEFADCNLVLIDLPTIDLNDRTSVNNCSRLLALLRSIEVLAVLDSRLQLGYLKRVLKDAKTFGTVRAVITQIDRVGCCIGAALSALVEEELPLAFISTGNQNLSQIEPASISRAAWFLTRQLLEDQPDVKKDVTTEQEIRNLTFCEFN